MARIVQEQQTLPHAHKMKKLKDVPVVEVVGHGKRLVRPSNCAPVTELGPEQKWLPSLSDVNNLPYKVMQMEQIRA